MSQVTFINQQVPIDEYGRAMYAVGRSVLRALLDQMSDQDLEDTAGERSKVTMRQLTHYARLERDKGMRGDGFEWAVHEAILGGESRVTDYVADALSKASPQFRGASGASSVMFGYERARYLGFLDATVQDAGDEAVLLPDGRGRPFRFTSSWLRLAARGQLAEPQLGPRIKQVWKTDLFLSDEKSRRYTACTIKSNPHELKGGSGLRVGIVPAATNGPYEKPGVQYDRNKELWVVVLPDPDGFMGLFNDAYQGVAQAVYVIGKHDRVPYFDKPSAKAQKMAEQMQKYERSTVVEIIEALDEQAQQDLIGVEHPKLLSVAAPDWLLIDEKPTPVLAPRPHFEPLE